MPFRFLITCLIAFHHLVAFADPALMSLPRSVLASSPPMAWKIDPQEQRQRDRLRRHILVNELNNERAAKQRLEARRALVAHDPRQLAQIQLASQERDQHIASLQAELAEAMHDEP